MSNLKTLTAWSVYRAYVSFDRASIVVDRGQNLTSNPRQSGSDVVDFSLSSKTIATALMVHLVDSLSACYQNMKTHHWCPIFTHTYGTELSMKGAGSLMSSKLAANAKSHAIFAWLAEEHGKDMWIGLHLYSVWCFPPFFDCSQRSRNQQYTESINPWNTLHKHLILNRASAVQPTRLCNFVLVTSNLPKVLLRCSAIAHTVTLVISLLPSNTGHRRSIS